MKARRAGTGRRLWKWVKRNPAVAMLAAISIVILLGGAGVSSYYAVKASRQAKLTADEAERALVSAREAMTASEQAKDALCRGSFDQARALRLAGQPGWRDKSLELVRKSAELRARDRADGEPPDDLPTLPDLRTEAVGAFLRADAPLTRALPVTIAMAAAHVSSDGRRLVQMQADLSHLLQSELRQIDLDTGAVIGRTQFKLDPMAADKNLDTDNFALLGINGLNRD